MYGGSQLGWLGPCKSVDMNSGRENSQQQDDDASALRIPQWTRMTMANGAETSDPCFPGEEQSVNLPPIPEERIPTPAPPQHVGHHPPEAAPTPQPVHQTPQREGDCKICDTNIAEDCQDAHIRGNKHEAQARPPRETYSDSDPGEPARTSDDEGIVNLSVGLGCLVCWWVVSGVVGGVGCFLSYMLLLLLIFSFFYFCIYSE